MLNKVGERENKNEYNKKNPQTSPTMAFNI